MVTSVRSGESSIKRKREKKKIEILPTLKFHKIITTTATTDKWCVNY
jgi:hypothetical protein